MFLFKKIILFLIFEFVHLQESKNRTSVCYDGYGCFEITPPFGGTSVRPTGAGILPESPTKIGTTFILFSLNNPSGEPIRLNQIPSNFNSKKLTKVIIHGFMHSAKKKWVLDMKDALLRAGDFNVIAVDYSNGNGFPYGLASSNARIVGVDVAKLIDELIAKTNAKMDDFHLIGHSLGCHVAGYAGERLKGLVGRITGLDPAGPYFEFSDNRVKLDSTDGKFVDIIHTDGSSTALLGLGLLEPAGHVDFYPNGGYNQPNCAQLSGKILTGLLNIVTVNIDNLEDVSGCSHVSAYKFFTDSIENKDCSYFGYQCKSKDDFDKGNCIKCSEKGCNKMGFWASPNKDLGNLYLNTQDANNTPFCKYNYQIQLVSNNLSTMKQTRGKLTVTLKSSKTTSTTETIDDSNNVFSKDLTTSHLVSLTSLMTGKIETVTLYFKKTSNFINAWLYDNEWSFKYLDVNGGYEQMTQRFCPVKAIIKTDEKVDFLPCS